MKVVVKFDLLSTDVITGGGGGGLSISVIKKCTLGHDNMKREVPLVNAADR